MTAHFPTPSEAARLAAAAFWIVVLAALFAGWLTSGNSARMAWKRDLATDCVSLGRGGARCPERSANDKGAGDPSGAADNCAALGKGGQVCFGRAVADKGAD